MKSHEFFLITSSARNLTNHQYYKTILGPILGGDRKEQLSESGRGSTEISIETAIENPFPVESCFS